MSTFEKCAIGDKVLRTDGYVGEIVSITAKRFRARFAWPEPLTVWRGNQAEKTKHFLANLGG